MHYNTVKLEKKQAVKDEHAWMQWQFKEWPRLDINVFLDSEE